MSDRPEPRTTQRRYRYTEEPFGDFIISGDGRMFGSEFAIPVDAVLEVLEGDFVVIPKSELPEVRPDGKLEAHGEFGRGLPLEESDRSRFYRAEALGKLALSLNSALLADRKAKLTSKLASDLERHLQHSDMNAFAKSLVALGWTKASS